MTQPAIRDPRNILIISMGGIGNLVMLTPAIAVMCRRFPSAKFHYLLVRNRSREIVEHHPQTGSIIEVEDTQRFLPVLSRLRQIRPDLVYSATGTNPLKCGALGIFTGAKLRVGERFGAGRFLYNLRVHYAPDLHEVAANLRIAAAVAPGGEAPVPWVWTDESDRLAAAAFAARFSSDLCIGFHAGSGAFMAYKRWPLERYAQLGALLATAHNCRILIFDGPDERSTAEELAARIGDAAVSCAGILTVRQTYELMKRCRVFVSNDSGPMHLAAAAGCRVVALFGATRETRTGPWGDGHRIVKTSVPCRPCYRQKPVDCVKWDCMSGISVDDVHRAVRDILLADTDPRTGVR